MLLQRYTFWSNSQQALSIETPDINCACYCKDTHFEAIHNRKASHYKDRELCLLLQRYTFWSNSQQPDRRTKRSDYCACYCKDTHFEAIHNALAPIICVVWIVLATAKIHILKQFTTIVFKQPGDKLLCLLLQRYTFWSNSQHTDTQRFAKRDCACYCKDTHFEAIHNTTIQSIAFASIVLATAKIHILKQFTTRQRFWRSRTLLCLLLQRYTFWSNSQPDAGRSSANTHCACYCKDTHFEAIHNTNCT